MIPFFFRFRIILALSVILIFQSCREEEQVQVTSKNELYLFLDTLESEYENICSSIERAYQCNFLGNHQGNTDSLWAEAARIFLDTSIYHTIVEWHERSGSLADKELKRRLELWYRTFLGGKIFFDSAIYQLRNDLLRQYQSNLKREQIPEQSYLTVNLQKEKNQTRRKAIYQRDLRLRSGLIPDYIRLVKLCNEKVRELGFPNYYSFMLYLDSIDEMRFLETIETLESHSREAYLRLLDILKEKYRTFTPAPWNLDHLFGIQPETAHKYFPADSLLAKLKTIMENIGASCDSLNIKIEAKRNYPTSRCFEIHIPDSVETVLRTRSGLHAFREGLFVMGEALHAVSVNTQYPILKGYTIIPGSSSASFHEGTAQVLQYFMDDSLRLTLIYGVKAKEVTRYLEQRAVTDLYNIRRLISDFYTEYRIFQDPGQDLDSMATDNYRQYLSDTSQAELRINFAPSLQHLSLSGEIYKGILREIISAQLYEALINKFGAESYYTPKVAPWLRHSLYQDGEMREWQDRIKEATGKSVEPGPLLRKLRIEQTEILTYSGKTLQ